jgi:hypothetical protein
MDIQELSDWVIKNNIAWHVDGDNIMLKNEQYNEVVKISPSALKKLKDTAELQKILVNGRDVEHITRVTGYLSRVSGWNKGKTGELKDRDRIEI